MQISVAPEWAVAVLLLTLRLAPLFAFAPPFTLLSIPLRVRVMVPLVLAACLIQAPGARLTPLSLGLDTLLVLAASEVMIGLGIAFAFQAAFAALYFAGRVLDVQGGFGMATVLDPATRTQTPMVGTLFVFAAAAVFFSVNGHHELMRVLAASLQAVPIGTTASGWSFQAVLAHVGTIFVLGVMTAGAGMAVLLVVDVALGFLSRTLPQMNILLLGIQVKTIVLLLMLLSSVALLAPAFLRVTEASLRFISGLEP